MLENGFDFGRRDAARVVLVKDAEGGLELVVTKQLLLVDGSDHKLGVINVPRVVGVNSGEHLVNLIIADELTVMSQVAVSDLLFGEFTVTVLVKGLEDLGKRFFLFTGKKLGTDVGKSGGFKSIVLVEVLKVVKGIFGCGLIDFNLGMVANPDVLKGLLGRGTLGNVNGQHLSDEVLSVSAHRVPHLVSEVKLSLLDCTHNLGVSRTVERRNATEQDVSDDTKTPHVALLAVTFLKNLRSDVVRCANLFFQLLGGVEDLSSTEVNNLDLVELLVCLEHNVLRL